MRRVLTISIALVAIAGLVSVLGGLSTAVKLVSQSLLFGGAGDAMSASEYFWEDMIWTAFVLPVGAAQIFLAMWAFKRRKLGAAA